MSTQVDFNKQLSYPLIYKQYSKITSMRTPRGKIYPMAISGLYRKIKKIAGFFLLAIYMLGSWLRWSRPEGYPNQAIMIDLPQRRGYFFGIEIWPDEVYYITAILIMAALGLFLFTSLFGRLWCGYTCPHTVFVDMFVAIEKFFQGDHNSRKKLDQQIATPENKKILKKLATHICWLLLGFLFAFGFVSYFYNAPTLLQDVISFNVAPAATIWLIGLTFSTYLMAGYARWRVCMYMCPYGRFQSGMLDNDSYIVTYQAWRGEPRGKKGEPLGDCIDCDKCYQVCPMGIDIRNGLQMACIGCGLCIDACDGVMSKLERDLGLIRYDSENCVKLRSLGKKCKNIFIRPKTIIFATMFAIAFGLMSYQLTHKPVMNLSLSHDRSALFTTLPDGSIRNTYQARIVNRAQHPRQVELSIAGLAQAQFKLQRTTDYAPTAVVELQPGEEKEVKLFIKVAGTDANPIEKITDFSMVMRDLHSNKIIECNSRFILGG
jgi:cytochrome c oxidase accessory protein FixG